MQQCTGNGTQGVEEEVDAVFAPVLAVKLYVINAVCGR